MLSGKPVLRREDYLQPGGSPTGLRRVFTLPRPPALAEPRPQAVARVLTALYPSTARALDEAGAPPKRRAGRDMEEICPAFTQGR